MIELKHLHKSFGKRHVLHGICLSFAPARVTGVLGPNACGKTTLMKSILGLVLPDSGEVLVGGVAVGPKSGNIEYRAGIGYMAQNPVLPENLRVEEIFRLIEDLRDKKAPRKQELVRKLELGSTLKRPFGELSGGMKQRVAAVVALMFDPAILILDEPTASLDPVAAVLLRGMIRDEGASGKTVIVISHSAAEIEELANDIVFMLDGRVTYAGPINDLIRKHEPGRSSMKLDEAIVDLFHTEARAAPEAGRA